eukprot:2982455-Pleurochrysis_carterae.AAC.1
MCIRDRRERGCSSARAEKQSKSERVQVGAWQERPEAVEAAESSGGRREPMRENKEEGEKRQRETRCEGSEPWKRTREGSEPWWGQREARKRCTERS